MSSLKCVYFSLHEDPQNEVIVDTHNGIKTYMCVGLDVPQDAPITYCGKRSLKETP